MKNNKVVIILCMHRSGSSLIASLLHHIGVYMGNKCDWKSWDNIKGFYEDREIVFLNEQILSFYERGWFDPPDIAIINKIHIKDKITNRIKSIIEKRNENELWGWKDPRTVFTFPLYEPYLKEYIFICPERDKEAIAKSLQKRNHFDFDFCLALIDKYEEARRYILNRYKADRYWVFYENLIQGNYQELVNISSALDLPLNLNTSDIIDKSLKHF